MSKKANIIFVDDDPKAGELMQRFSESASFTCHVFQDSQLALDYFKDNGADLIL